MRCPHCRAELTAHAKFCSECGVKLAPAHSQSPRPSGERRQVTILFADITGYTQLSSQIDPEELHGLLERYFALVDGTIRDFGGTVDKHIGDAVMGVFGAPVSHGNDAERAVRATFAIHERVSGLETGLGRALSVHIGVANGEVVAGTSGSDVHREYTVLGDAVNLASRLDGLAGAGETAVSAGVYRSVASFVEADFAGELAVKGLSAPVRVFKLRGIRERLAEQEAPILGRARELRTFDSFLPPALAGEGGVLGLLGEPGVGKTRVVTEIRRRAREQGFAVHTGLVLDFGAERGQDAARVLVKSALGLALDAGSEERLAALRQTLAARVIAAEDSPGAYDLLDLAPPAALRGDYEALTEERRVAMRERVLVSLFRHVSAAEPVLAVIEDVHWANRETLALVRALGEGCGQTRMVTILTSRVDGCPLDAAFWQSLAPTRTEQLLLEPLDESALLELADHWGSKDPERARACALRSGGNPLFMEQLLASEAEGALPDSVQSLVQARMDRLAPADKRALQAASVIGQRFSLSLLRHLIDEPDYSVQTLAERGLVRPVEEGWLFSHALVRDGAYSSLLKQARRDFHRRAAAWFGSSDPVLRAEHLDRAEDEDAPGAYAAAASVSIQALDYERAEALLRRGLEIATTPRDVHLLSFRRGELMLFRADAEAALSAFENARGAARSALESCRAWIGLADSYRIVQRAEDGRRAVDQALGFIQDGMDAELSAIHRIRGSIAFTRGENSQEDQELALKHAVRAGVAELEARALSCLGDASYLSGHSRRAYDYFTRAVELCRKHGLGRVELYQYYMIGFVRLLMNDCRGAVADCEHAMLQASRAGHRRAEMLARETMSIVLLEAGDWQGALVQSTLGGELAIATGSTMFQAVLLAERAEALAVGGRVDEARATFLEGKELSLPSDWWLVHPLLYAVAPRVSRDEAEAEAWLVEGERFHQKVDLMAANFRVRAARACLERGYDALAERFARAAEGMVPDSVWVELQTEVVLRLLELRRGARGASLTERLAALRAEAERGGFAPVVATIDRELAAV